MFLVYRNSSTIKWMTLKSGSKIEKATSNSPKNQVNVDCFLWWSQCCALWIPTNSPEPRLLLFGLTLARWTTFYFYSFLIRKIPTNTKLIILSTTQTLIKHHLGVLRRLRAEIRRENSRVLYCDNMHVITMRLSFVSF